VDVVVSVRITPTAAVLPPACAAARGVYCRRAIAAGAARSERSAIAAMPAEARMSAAYCARACHALSKFVRPTALNVSGAKHITETAVARTNSPQSYLLATTGRVRAESEGRTGMIPPGRYTRPHPGVDARPRLELLVRRLDGDRSRASETLVPRLNPGDVEVPHR